MNRISKLVSCLVVLSAASFASGCALETSDQKACDDSVNAASDLTSGPSSDREAAYEATADDPPPEPCEGASTGTVDQALITEVGFPSAD